MMTSYDKSHESKSIILLHGIKFLIVSLPIGFCISVFIVLILRLFGIDMNNKLSALSLQQRIQLYPWAGLFAFGVVAPFAGGDSFQALALIETMAYRHQRLCDSLCRHHPYHHNPS